TWGGGTTAAGPTGFVRVVQAVTGISTRMSRLLSEPLPPTPLPEAERGVGGRGCPTARKGQEFGKGISRSLAELELVVHRDHVLVAVRGRRFVLGICLLAGLLVFLDHLEVAHVFLFLLACLGAAPGRGRAALGRTGTSLNEPAQRGDRQPGLDPDQVVVADLAGSKEIADLLKRVRTPHTSATHHAERLPCRGGSSTQGDPTHTFAFSGTAFSSLGASLMTTLMFVSPLSVALLAALVRAFCICL